MFYKIVKNGTYTLLELPVCKKHGNFKFEYFETLHEKKNEKLSQCCAYNYDGTRCTSLDVEILKKDRRIVKIDKSEILEIQNVFKKYLKVIGLSKMQFENFVRMIHLFMSTPVHEIFQENHNIDAPLSKKFLINYEYVFDKIKNFNQDFKIEEINLTKNLNEITPQYIRKNALDVFSGPEFQFQLSPKFKSKLKHEKMMYRNYVIFINLLYALSCMDDRARAYYSIFLNENLKSKYSFIRVVLDIYKSLFNQIEKIKETDVPKLHELLEEQCYMKILPALMKNLLYNYEKDLLENSFQ